MKECNISANKSKCTCTYEPCSRKGRCCECLNYHWRNQEIPGCMFPPNIERTFDRSLSRFISCYK